MGVISRKPRVSLNAIMYLEIVIQVPNDVIFSNFQVGRSPGSALLVLAYKFPSDVLRTRTRTLIWFYTNFLNHVYATSNVKNEYEIL